jgi:hypothetical protein
MAKRVELDIAIRTGDTSGLKAVDDFNAGLERAKGELNEIRANGGLAGVAVSSDELVVAEARLISIADQINKTRQELVDAEIAMKKAGEEGGDAFEKAERKVISLKAQIVELNNRAGDTVRRLGSDFDIGAIGSTFSPLSSVARTAGAGPLGDLLGSANDFSDLAEYMPRFKEAIGGLVDTFKAGAGQADTLAGAVTGGFTALAGAIGPVVLLIGGAVAVIGVWSEVFRQLEEDYQQQTRVIENTRTAIIDEIEMRQRLTELIENGTREQVQQRIDSLAIEREIINANLTYWRGLLQGVQDEYDAMGAALDPGRRSELGRRGQEFQAEIDKILDGPLGRINTEIAALMGLLPDVVANDEARAAIEEQVNLIQTEARVREQVNQLLRTGTAEQIRERQDQIQQETAGLLALRESLLPLVDSSQTAADAVKQVEQRLTELGTESTGLFLGLPGKEAAEAEAEAQQQALDALLARRDAEQEISELLRTASAEQVNTRQDQIEDEIAAIKSILPELRQLAQTSDDAAKQLEAAENQLSSLTAEAARLDEIEPAVRLREFREEADKLEKGLTDSIDRLTKARDNRLNDLAAKLETSLGNLGDAYAEAVRKDKTAGTDALEEFFKDERQRVKDHRADLLRIQQEGDLRATDAAADRNIRGALEAERDTQKQLEQQQKTFDAESEKRAQELEELKDHIEDTQRDRFRDYQKRYNDLIAANQREVQATNQKYQADITMQVQAYNVELANLNTLLRGEMNMKAQGYNGMLLAAAEYANRLIAIGNNLRMQGTGKQVIAPDYIYVKDPFAAGILQRAGGGDTPPGVPVNYNENGIESGISRGRLGIFSDPTYILDAQKTQRLLNGDTSVLPGASNRNAGAGGGDTFIIERVETIIQGAGQDAETLARLVEQRVTPNILSNVQQAKARQGRL